MKSADRKFAAAALLTVITAVIATALVVASGAAWAQEVAQNAPPDVVRWGMIAAALAAGISAIGAAYAVAQVGSAAVGAIAEKPELFGRALILVGLAEGIAIYGLIVAILILNRIG